MTPEDLKNFQPGDFVSAQNEWGSASAQVGGAQGSLTSVCTNMGGWTGPASDAARTALDDLARLVTPVARALHDAQYDVQAFLAAVEKAQGTLNQGITMGNSVGQVDMSSGVVTPNKVGAAPGADAQAVKTAGDQTSHNAQVAAQATQMIQGAVRDATAADQNAAGRLNDGAGAAGTAGSTNLAGGQVTPLNIGRLAGAQQWYGSEVNVATALAQKAANGNAQAAQQLGPYSYLFANDHTFATSVLTALGPQQVTDLENQLGSLTAWTKFNRGPTSSQFQSITQSQNSLNSFLSSALASATSGALGSTWPGAPNQLPSTWVQNLMNASSVPGPTPNHGSNVSETPTPAYWALGQILNGAGAGNNYSSGLLGVVAPTLQNYDAQMGGHGAGTIAVEPFYPGLTTKSVSFDPLVGLMRAASTNPSWTQQYLTENNGQNLNYLLKTHQWADPGSDQGTALGTAVLGASQPSAGPESLNLTNSFVNTYGRQLAGNQAGTEGDNLSGLRTATGVLLSQHVDELSRSTVQLLQGQPPDPGAPLGDPGTGLGFVLEQVGKSPTGYAALLQAETNNLQASQNDPAARSAASVLIGTTYNAHALGIDTAAKEKDFDDIASASENNTQTQQLLQLGTTIAQLIPGAGPWLYYGGTAFGDTVQNPTFEKELETATTTGQQEEVQLRNNLQGQLDLSAFDTGSTSLNDTLNQNGILTYSPPRPNKSSS